MSSASSPQPKSVTHPTSNRFQPKIDQLQVERMTCLPEAARHRSQYFRPVRFGVQAEIDSLFGLSQSQKQQLALRFRDEDGGLWYDRLEREEFRHLLSDHHSPVSPVYSTRRSSAASTSAPSSPAYCPHQSMQRDQFVTTLSLFDGHYHDGCHGFELHDAHPNTGQGNTDRWDRPSSPRRRGSSVDSSVLSTTHLKQLERPPTGEDHSELHPIDRTATGTAPRSDFARAADTAIVTATQRQPPRRRTTVQSHRTEGSKAAALLGLTAHNKDLLVPGGLGTGVHVYDGIAITGASVHLASDDEEAGELQHSAARSRQHAGLSDVHGGGRAIGVRRWIRRTKAFGQQDGRH